MLPWKDKKALYGKKNFIPVGGKTETDDKGSDMNRLANKPDSVCYHSMPGALLDELMQQFWTKLVIDLAAGDGRFGSEALKNRVGYLGITFAPEHSALPEQRMFHTQKDGETEKANKMKRKKKEKMKRRMARLSRKRARRRKMMMKSSLPVGRGDGEDDDEEDRLPGVLQDTYFSRLPEPGFSF